MLIMKIYLIFTVTAIRAGVRHVGVFSLGFQVRSSFLRTETETVLINFKLVLTNEDVDGIMASKMVQTI